MATNKKELKINYHLNFFSKKKTIFSSVINLDIKISRLFVYGKVGSGKSSFLKTIAGIIKPKFCELTFDKKIITHTKKKIFTPLYKRKIVYLWQESILFSHLNVLENLLFSNEAKNFSNKNYWINALGIKNLLFKIPEELSGGEKQKSLCCKRYFQNLTCSYLMSPFRLWTKRPNKIAYKFYWNFKKYTSQQLFM